MTQTPMNRKILGLALGSLMTTSLGTGMAGAATPEAPQKRGVLQQMFQKTCNATCGSIRFDSMLSKCAKDCPETTTHLLEKLRGQKAAKEAEREKIQNDLKKVGEKLRAVEKTPDIEPKQIKSKKNLYKELENEKTTKEKGIRNIVVKINILTKQIQAIEKVMPTNPPPLPPRNTESSQGAATSHPPASGPGKAPPPPPYLPPPPTEGSPPTAELTPPPVKNAPPRPYRAPWSASPAVTPSQQNSSGAPALLPRPTSSSQLPARSVTPPPPPPLPPVRSNPPLPSISSAPIPAPLPPPVSSTTPSPLPSRTAPSSLLDQLQGAQLKKPAAQPPATTPRPSSAQQALANAVIGRRPSRDEPTQLTAADQKTLDKLLNEGKTPQQIQEMMQSDDHWDLFENSDLVGKKLQIMEKNSGGN